MRIFKHPLKIQNWIKPLANSLTVLFGIFCASLGIKGFLLPNHFIDGGVTGISMLISDIFNIELAIVILLINIPFVILGSQQISWKFAVRSTLAIVTLAIIIHFIDFPILTSDKLLSAIFGGIALGAGIGFALRSGAVLDGTEILAILLSKRFSMKVGDIILLFNAVIFSVGALFIGLEPALYSILTYVTVSKTIDFLVYGFGMLGVNIISKHSEKIKDAMITKLGLGVTIFVGKRGYTQNEQEILFCVCSRLESQELKSLVKELDKEAFITIHKITDSYGGLLKRPHYYHP